MCLYVCSRSMYVCSKSMTGRGFSNIHTCSRGIHTCSRAFFSEFYYNLTWRFLDRGSVLFDFFSLDKPVCPKTPLPVMLFWHTRFKNQRKRYPRRGIVILSWVGIAKTLTGNGVLDLSPSPLDDACSTYMHTCSTYMHAQHTYIHAQHTYIHAQHTCIHTCTASEASEAPKSRYPAWTKKCVQTLVSAIVLKHSGEPVRNLIFWASGGLSKHGPPSMYVCMSETSKHVCMYVCMLSMYVCMLSMYVCMYVEHVCMYVNRHTYMHTYTYILTSRPSH